MNKIFTINNLKNEIKKVKNKNLKIVHCHGVFDLIHIGHIKHFKEAKKNGDFLIVSITADKFVNKGSGRPIFNQNLRAEFLSSLSFVDVVTINENQTSEKLISIIKPDIYFKGPDYKNNQKDGYHRVYLLEDYNYVGVTNNINHRFNQHKWKSNRDCTNHRVLYKTKDRSEALELEALLHDMGYEGGAKNNKYA